MIHSIPFSPTQARAELSRAERARRAIARVWDPRGARIQHRLARRMSHRDTRSKSDVYRHQRLRQRRRGRVYQCQWPSGDALPLGWPRLPRSRSRHDPGSLTRIHTLWLMRLRIRVL